MNSNYLRDAWAGLELRSQVTLIGGVIAVLGAFYMLYGYASKQSYSTLATNLAPSQTGQAEQALASAGISYRIATGGTEIDVPASQLSQARVSLAEKGVLGNTQTGFSVFNKTSLGTTDFQQQVQYQQALQTEIAQTINQIQGVNSSTVELVLPDDTLFATQTAKATAAVLVNGGSNLDRSTIQGIAHLVSSSVKGLNTSDVTITDETGSLLWPSSGSGGGSGATTKLEADNLYSSQLSAQVNALLTSTLGPNKALARVQADLNADQTTLEKVSYAKKGVPLTKQTQSESLSSKGGGAALPAGTAANTGAAAAATTSGNGTSTYSNSTSSTSFGVAKTVQRSVLAPGSVNKLDVALIIDNSVPAAQVTSLKKSIASLVGLNTKRGDTIAVSQIAFARPKVVKPVPANPMASIMANPIGLAKDVGVGLAALIFLFLMRRSLKRREGEASVPAPTWLRELQSGITVAELEGAPLQLPPVRKDPIREQIEEIANSSPEAIATQVSSWMRE